jgi:hypothetical protein
MKSNAILHFRNAVESALAALRSESARAETEQSEEELDAMRQALSTLLLRAEEGTLPPKELRYRVVTRQILECWPLVTEIGNLISEAEALYQEL